MFARPASHLAMLHMYVHIPPPLHMDTIIFKNMLYYLVVCEITILTNDASYSNDIIMYSYVLNLRPEQDLNKQV